MIEVRGTNDEEEGEVEDVVEMGEVEVGLRNWEEVWWIGEAERGVEEIGEADLDLIPLKSGLGGDMLL